jgi:hypothetical protein
MTVNDCLKLLKTAQREGKLLIASSIGGLKPVVSVSIRIDDTSKLAIVFHEIRAFESARCSAIETEQQQPAASDGAAKKGKQ